LKTGWNWAILKDYDWEKLTDLMTEKEKGIYLGLNWHLDFEKDWERVK